MDTLMTVLDAVNGRMSLDKLRDHFAAQMLQHAFDHVWDARKHLRERGASDKSVLYEALETLDDARLDVMP